MLPTPRFVALSVFVAVAFVTLGRPPGAVELRTREVESLISGASKAARDLRLPSAWILHA